MVSFYSAYFAYDCSVMTDTSSEASKWICIWGLISRTDQHENLHDGRALSRMWVSPLLVAISSGVSKLGVKMVFGQFVFHVASVACVIKTVVHWCVAVPFISGYCLLRLNGRQLCAISYNRHPNGDHMWPFCSGRPVLHRHDPSSQVVSLPGLNQNTWR